MGSCGSQTTFNSGRAVIAAAGEVREQLLDAAAEQLEAAKDDLELVGGAVRVKGSPDKSVTIAELAGGGHVPRQGRGRGARAAAERRRRGLRRPARDRVVPRAAADRPRRARQGRPRDRRRPRARRSPPPTTAGTILNRIGADGQVYGGVVMGIGQALSEGTQLDEDGRQRNAHLLDYKLVTASDAPQIDIAWIETDTPNAGPEGLEGRRRAAVRADGGGDRERDREGDRRARARSCR